MARMGIGLDIGADTVKVVAARAGGGRFIPLRAAILKRSGEDAGEIARFLAELGLSGPAMIGVSGKEMIIRYTQVPPMPDWQLKQVMGFEIDDLAAQSGGDLAADFNRLEIRSSLSDDDTILLTLVKNELLDGTLALLEDTKIRPEAFTPSAVALYNLAAATAEVHTGTSLVVDVGAENIDIAVVQEGALVFARNLHGGSRLFDRALMEAFNLGAAKAERVKRELGCIITRENAGNLSSQEEKVGRVLSGVAGRIYSMIQSSLMFCKAQIKVAELTLDRVYLTGGGARLRGLDRYLSDNLGVPVELLDPAQAMDLGRMVDGAELVEQGPAFACALGLAYMAAVPEHYAIHVLPEALERRRRFQTRTVFGILSAVLLVLFLGLKFYCSQADAALLDRDRRTLQRELGKRKRQVKELTQLAEENVRLAGLLDLLNEKIIPTTGMVRTFALVQKYLPDDLWIESVETTWEDREEFGMGQRKMPVIKVQGRGKEMGQNLQKSFTDFRMRLEADPRTSQVVPQVRYAPFSFTLLLNFTRYLEGSPESVAAEEGTGDGAG